MWMTYAKAKAARPAAATTKKLDWMEPALLAGTKLDGVDGG